MDNHEINEKGNKVPSVLQSDEMFSSRILGRQSTIGSCSSRIYYRAASEGVPFQWEKQPGKPIKPQPDDVLPPLSPPPAVLAMRLPKPSVKIMDEPPKVKKWSSAWLVKKFKKRLDTYHKKLSNVTTQQVHSNYGSARYHGESGRYSTSSFASTSTSSSTMSFRDHKNNSSNGNLSSHALTQGNNKPFTCSPMGFSDIVVYFVKKT